MADLAQLESALIKADAAGDTEATQILADEVRKARASQESVYEKNVPETIKNAVGGLETAGRMLWNVPAGLLAQGTGTLAGLATGEDLGQSIQRGQEAAGRVSIPPLTKAGALAEEAVGHGFEAVRQGVSDIGAAGETYDPNAPAGSPRANPKLEAVGRFGAEAPFDILMGRLVLQPGASALLRPRDSVKSTVSPTATPEVAKAPAFDPSTIVKDAIIRTEENIPATSKAATPSTAPVKSRTQEALDAGENPIIESNRPALINDRQNFEEAKSNGATPVKPLTEVDRELRGKLAQNDSRGALQVLADKSADPLESMLSRKLLKLPEFAPKVELGGVDKQRQGQYDPTSHTVSIGLTGRVYPMAQTFLHEAVHAAVYNIQKEFENWKIGKGTIALTDAQKLAADKIKTLYTDVMQHLNTTKSKAISDPLARPYGLKDQYEFIAEAFTHPGFQQLLKSIDLSKETKSASYGIKAKITNAWGTFVDSIRDMIGLPKGETNAFNLLLKHGAELIESSTVKSRMAYVRGAHPEIRAVASETSKPTIYTHDLRTPFEKEENLPKGAGLAVPDLKAPLEKRAMETLQQGQDLNPGSNRKLPNDLGSLFSKYFLNSEQLSKYIGEVNPLIKAVIDRIADKKRHWSAVREDIIKGAEMVAGHGVTALREFKRKAGGFRGIVENLPKDKQIEFFKARLEFDNAEVLRQAKQQWPTEEQLREKGYSKEAIQAYMTEAKYIDAAYELVNWARKQSGKDEIARIPGYFPHAYKGHRGIKIFAEDRVIGFTKTAGSEKDVVKAATAIIKELQDAGVKEKLTFEHYRTDAPGSTGDVITSLEHASEVFANSDSKLIQLVQKVINSRISSMEQQFLQSSLKREGVKGWIGHAGVDKSNIKDIITARNNYMESVIKYAESQDILRSIGESISPDTWKTLEERLPNTADFIGKVQDRARDQISLEKIDRTVMDFFSDKTGERFSYRWPMMGLNKLRGYFSSLDLAWSVSYHLGNAVQPEMMGSAALMREYSRIGKGNPAEAMLLAAKEQFLPRLENKRAIEWAARHKVITPKLMEEIDFMYEGKSVAKDILTGRRASELNEAVGRLRTFLMGLEYYRSAGLNEIQARGAAAKFVDDVMVDYSITGQPLWISSNPAGQIASKLLAPYAAFRHAFWGNTALAVQAIKNNPGSARKLLPFVQLQLSSAFFGGLRGTAFLAEGVALTHLFNNWWENQFQEAGPLPDPMKVMMEAGLGDWAMFGALSGASKQVFEHGADIGQTVAAPSAQQALTPRTAEGAIDVAKASYVFLKTLFADVADSEKLTALKAISPSYIHGMLEAAFIKNEDVVPDERNRMRGNVSRDAEDWRARILTGKRSLTEQRELIAKREIRKEEMHVKERKSDLTELAADFYEKEGYLNPDLVSKAIDEGYKYREFQQRVKELIKERQHSRLETMAGKRPNTSTRRRIRENIDQMLYNQD